MERNRKEIISQRTHFVSGHYPVSPRDTLAQLVDVTSPDAEADNYGNGDLIADFEAEVADLPRCGLVTPVWIYLPMRSRHFLRR